jgi:hypothetical protein
MMAGTGSPALPAETEREGYDFMPTRATKPLAAAIPQTGFP